MALVTDYQGKVYEHIEYTPYGELWVEHGPVGVEALAYRFTGKELDRETGLYYYGARYLNPRTSRWISTDAALAEYLPVAPVDDEARKHNRELPGMGGVFNPVTLMVYLYGGSNPLKYVDPDGNEHLNHIYLQVFRQYSSTLSRVVPDLQGQDYIKITNRQTGQTAYLWGAQTVSNHPDFDAGNTLDAWSGMTLSVRNPEESRFAGVSLMITDAKTVGGTTIGSDGKALDDPTGLPWALHSIRLKGRSEDLPENEMGGCIGLPYSQVEKLGRLLDEWGVKVGDTFSGWIYLEDDLGP